MGALFYKIGGYRLPFIAVGVLDFTLVFFMCTAKNDRGFISNQQQDNNQDESLRSWDIFKIPRANFALFNYFGAAAILSFT